MWNTQFMARPDTISRFLPIRFPNGARVRRFGKHCPHCRTMVNAEEMQGIACLLDNKLFLAAQAECPACARKFSISCVITDDKAVHRVLIPAPLFRLWLRLAVRNLPQSGDDNWELESAEQPLSHGRILDEHSQVIRSDTLLGRFEGVGIPDWIEHEGQRYLFERAAPVGSIQTLLENEVLLEGRLVYRQDTPPDQAV